MPFFRELGQIDQAFSAAPYHAGLKPASILKATHRHQRMHKHAAMDSGSRPE